MTQQSAADWLSDAIKMLSLLPLVLSFCTSVPSHALFLLCYSGRWWWRPGPPPPCVWRWILSTQCHLPLQVGLHAGTWCVQLEFSDMYILFSFFFSLFVLFFSALLSNLSQPATLVVPGFWLHCSLLITSILHGRLALNQISNHRCSY